LSTKIEPRAVVFVAVGPNNAPHPAVVLAVQEDGNALSLISGTGTRRTLPHVLVSFPSRAAFAMRLVKDTYFYEAGIAVAPARRVAPNGGRCPPDVFGKLEAFAAPRLAQIELAARSGTT